MILLTEFLSFVFHFMVLEYEIRDESHLSSHPVARRQGVKFDSSFNHDRPP